jgi:hypothetical protein
MKILWLFFILDIVPGFVWLIYRLRPFNLIAQNWQQLNNPDKTSFGRWTPFLGVLFGLFSFVLVIIELSRLPSDVKRK